MKIAIFGYPRSGSTLLQQVIVNHLESAGVMEFYQDLGEPFNPRETTRLVPHNMILRLENSDTPFEPMQFRDERFELFKLYWNQDYVIKVMSTDTANPEIIPWLLSNNYRFVTVERRDHFAALLSWLIAWQYQYWHHTPDNPRPDYQPFEADMEKVMKCCGFMARYFHWSDRIPSERVIYEDMVFKGPRRTLQSIGLWQDGGETPPPATRRLHKRREKHDLITNVEAVYEAYANAVGTVADLRS